LKGKFIGAHAPYGYRVDPDDHYHLLPDEETAPVVKEIFRMASDGININQIRKYLTDREILTPRAYIAKTTGKYADAINKQFPSDWNYSTVASVLRNREYCGHIISQKETTQSFKCKKTVFRPKAEWVTAPNMHAALVDEITFDKVQSFIVVKHRENKSNINNIFAGMIKCGACGYGLSYTSPHQRTNTGTFMCNLYRQRNRAHSCTSHYVTYRSIYDTVLDRFQRLSAFMEAHSGDLEVFFNQFLQQGSEMNSQSKRQELDRYQKRVRDLDSIVRKIVEQNALGTLTDERFAILTTEYEAEQRDLKDKIEKLQALVNRKRDSLQNAGHFLNAISKYKDITELDVSTLHELIEKIVVHEADGVGKARTQDIDIHWRFVGILPDK